jgi:hypothetical protein
VQPLDPVLSLVKSVLRGNIAHLYYNGVVYAVYGGNVNGYGERRGAEIPRRDEDRRCFFQFLSKWQISIRECGIKTMRVRKLSKGSHI